MLACLKNAQYCMMCIWLIRMVFALFYHLNTNHYIFVGERPYKCELCPYSSSQKTHLTRHMRTHSGW